MWCRNTLILFWPQQSSTSNASLEFRAARIALRVDSCSLHKQPARHALLDDRWGVGQGLQHLQGNRLEARWRGTGVELVADAKVLQALQGGNGAESLPVMAQTAPGGSTIAGEGTHSATLGVNHASPRPGTPEEGGPEIGGTQTEPESRTVFLQTSSGYHQVLYKHHYRCDSMWEIGAADSSRKPCWDVGGAARGSSKYHSFRRRRQNHGVLWRLQAVRVGWVTFVSSVVISNIHFLFYLFFTTLYFLISGFFIRLIRLIWEIAITIPLMYIGYL